LQCNQVPDTRAHPGRNYFDAQLFPGIQLTEFASLQQGVADFAIGSTVNWCLQVKELNLFGLPFMFPSYSAVAKLDKFVGQLRFMDVWICPVCMTLSGFFPMLNLYQY